MKKIIIIFIIIVMIIAYMLFLKSTNNKRVSPILLSGVHTFLETHKEFGQPIRVQSIPDWEKGKRERVHFKNGRNLLFYLKDDIVVTVYEDFIKGERKIIWDNYSSDAIDAKNVERKADITIPKYTIIERIELIAGGKHADILLPSITRETKIDIRKRIAFAILKKEKLRSLTMFSTREAFNASYSISYAEQHPGAIDGYIGAISMHTGEFED